MNYNLSDLLVGGFGIYLLWLFVLLAFAHSFKNSKHRTLLLYGMAFSQLGYHLLLGSIETVCN